jgi:hypothetical protein
MTWTAPDVIRDDEPSDGDERALLELFCTPENRNAEFDEVDAAAAPDDLEVYRAEVAWVTDTIRHRSLEDTFYEPHRESRPTLRGCTCR